MRTARYRIPLALLGAIALPLGASGLEWAAAGDVKQALAGAREQDQPLAMVFSATWCGACRKFATTTLSNRGLDEIGRRFTWVKVDVDDHPAVAARYGVRAIPSLVIVDGEGHVVARASGFLDKLRLLDVLADALGEDGGDLGHRAAVALATTDRADALTDEQAVELVLPLVQRLADPSRAGRDVLLMAVKRLGERVHSRLLELMEHDELRIRAAASGALAYVTREAHLFDAFGDAETRARQTAAWRAALGP